MANDYPAQHVRAEKLARLRPGAECCDCGLEVAQAAADRPNQRWTIWHEQHVYCPKCAAHENIGPES